jgi:maleate isomerase
MTSPASRDVGVGVIVPHDMRLDRELWRWAPSDVALFFTRTPHTPLAVTVEMVARISRGDHVAQCTKDLVATESEVYAYACTSGSFLRGPSGERDLVAAMQAAGAPHALTTSGAFLRAIECLGVSRVSVALPYLEDLSVRLEAFLTASGVEVVSSAHLGLVSDIASVPYETTVDLVRRADHPDAQAVLVSCTNLSTYDVIAGLEEELGKPVVTANQATMWAALKVIGRVGVGPGQRLLTV